MRPLSGRRRQVPVRLVIGLVCGLAAVAAPKAQAHDVWIQPSSFWLAPGQPAAIVLRVGHGQDQARAAMPGRRIVSFDAVGPSGARKDLRRALKLGSPEGDAELQLDAPGVHLLVLATDNRAQSHLPADRFNAHLEAEGLQNAVELRKRQGRTHAPGSERYSRVAKTVVRVAGETPGRRWSGPVLGLPLEILLERDPSEGGNGNDLGVRVLQSGRPLAGALVKLGDLPGGDRPPMRRRTDALGRVSFPAPRAGQWLLSVVSTRPAPPDSGTDFESVFSTLTFAVGREPDLHPQGSPSPSVEVGGHGPEGVR